MKIPRSPFSDQTEDLSSSYQYLVVAVIFFFLIVLLRLWYLQIVRGSEFRVLSESNRTRVQDIIPPRGLIKDSHGLILVDNHPAYDLAVIREDVADFDKLADRLSGLLNQPWTEIREKLEATKMRPAFQPSVVLSGLSRQDVGALETHRYELPGVVIQVKPQRKYLHHQLASHVIGYLGEVTQEQLNNPDFKNSRMGDLIGRYGIEQQWEDQLQGRRGRRLVEVDAAGRVQRLISQINPIPGYNLVLTIDEHLQQAAQAALGDTAGAVVAVDPRNGEVLAMASNPTFDQNDFVKGVTQEQWKALSNNPMHPLENRAVSGQYPPGSTYKIVSAVAALEEGVVTPDTKIMCTGGYPLGNRVFHCWKKTGHGYVDLHQALVESCDVYFYEVGVRLGIDRLAKWAKAFGLGEKTGVGLATEKSGIVPSTDWKRARFKDVWHQGETLSVVIGQGYNLATPLQMAQVVAVAVNGGVLYRPHLVKEVTDVDGQLIKSIEPQVIRRLNLKPGTVKAVREALAGVVSEPRGTGKPVRMEGITVGGKTGTAQVVGRNILELHKKEIPYKYRDHAWFVAAAPMEDPTIAVAVIAEHSGHGGSFAGPIARSVLEAYFHPEAPIVRPESAEAAEAEDAVAGD